jgi:hypothetical protein
MFTIFGTTFLKLMTFHEKSELNSKAPKNDVILEVFNHQKSEKKSRSSHICIFGFGCVVNKYRRTFQKLYFIFGV